MKKTFTAPGRRRALARPDGGRGPDLHEARRRVQNARHALGGREDSGRRDTRSGAYDVEIAALGGQEVRATFFDKTGRKVGEANGKIVEQGGARRRRTEPAEAAAPGKATFQDIHFSSADAEELRDGRAKAQPRDRHDRHEPHPHRPARCRPSRRSARPKAPRRRRHESAFVPSPRSFSSPRSPPRPRPRPSSAASGSSRASTSRRRSSSTRPSRRRGATPSRKVPMKSTSSRSREQGPRDVLSGRGEAGRGAGHSSSSAGRPGRAGGAPPKAHGISSRLAVPASDAQGGRRKLELVVGQQGANQIQIGLLPPAVSSVIAIAPAQKNRR